jgi:heme-degrading monooxygenase HmoA
MSYARVARFRLKPGINIDELVRKLEEALLTRLREQPGFLSYTAIRVADDSVIAITCWKTREHGEQGVRGAEQWNLENVGSAVESAEAYFGEVIAEHTVDQAAIDKVLATAADAVERELDA